MRCMEWLLEEAAVVMDMPLNVFLLINIRIKKIYPIWYSFFSHNTVYFTYNVISVAILVGSRDQWTQFWKRAIQIPFHQSLDAIDPMVSEEKIKVYDGRRTPSDRPGELKTHLN